jgi:hypothetical protein
MKQAVSVIYTVKYQKTRNPIKQFGDEDENMVLYSSRALIKNQ